MKDIINVNGNSYSHICYNDVIAKNVLVISKIPKCHQLDGIAAVDPSLDATLCGKWNKEELCVVVWLLTRITPNFKITHSVCEIQKISARRNLIF